MHSAMTLQSEAVPVIGGVFRSLRTKLLRFIGAILREPNTMAVPLHTAASPAGNEQRRKKKVADQ